MRIKQQILLEIKETEEAMIKLKESGAPDNQIQFFDGWNQALAWVLTTTDIEGDA